MNDRREQIAGRIALVLALCCLCAIDAYGWSADSLLIQSIKRKQETISFVAWIVLGLAAGFTGSQLANGKGGRILPDILTGVAGALTGGWLFYTFGPLPHIAHPQITPAYWISNAR